MGEEEEKRKRNFDLCCSVITEALSEIKLPELLKWNVEEHYWMLKLYEHGVNGKARYPDIITFLEVSKKLIENWNSYGDNHYLFYDSSLKSILKEQFSSISSTLSQISMAVHNSKLCDAKKGNQELEDYFYFKLQTNFLISGASIIGYTLSKYSVSLVVSRLKVSSEFKAVENLVQKSFQFGLHHFKTSKIETSQCLLEPNGYATEELKSLSKRLVEKLPDIEVDVEKEHTEDEDKIFTKRKRFKNNKFENKRINKIALKAKSILEDFACFAPKGISEGDDSDDDKPMRVRKVIA